MEQGQINEILKHQKDFFSAIDIAVEKDLAIIQMPAKELKERIIEGLRWGLFLRKNVRQVHGLRTAVFNSRDEYELEPLMRLNFHEIRSLQEEMEAYGFYHCPIFSDKIDKKFLDTEIQVNFCHDTLESNIREIRSIFSRTDTKKLLKCFDVKLTLPDAEEIFDIEEGGYPLDAETIAELDAYDHWKWSIEKHYDSLLQIGGNGRWTQYNYGETYIAQVNNDVGDAGAVYVTLSKKGDFKSFVEMY
jgi:hypothetical protein